MMNDTPSATQSARLEFRFRWNPKEHRQFFRVLQREGRSKFRFALNVWMGLMLIVTLRGLSIAKSSQDAIFSLVAVVFVLAWFAFDRWGLAYLNARSYAREHARCLPHDQLVILTAAGIETRCTTTTWSITWSGVKKTREVPHFFLFFTGNNSAVFLPKRAVPDVTILRHWLDQRFGERVS